MLLTECLAFVAGGLCVAFTLYLAIRKPEKASCRKWWIPATTSLGFSIFSAWAVITEGPLGFWTEHSARNLWGNQIWFDLLLMASVAWCLVLPRAHQQRMRVVPWLLLIFLTGSVGFLAMLARLFYLEQKAIQPAI